MTSSDSQQATYRPTVVDETRLAEHLYMKFERSNGSDMRAARALWNGASRHSDRVRRSWTRQAQRALKATFRTR